jgi:hypothetical protein
MERGHTLTLMDASSALLRIAAGRCPGAEVLLGDICNPELTEAFDAVICRGVLNDLTEEHERASALDAFAALLRPGGTLVLDVRESDASQRRADGRWRSIEVGLANGARLTFSNRPTWCDGRIVVDERYELVPATGEPSSVREYRFEMLPWSRDELEARLSDAGFIDVHIDAGIGRRTPDRLFVTARLKPLA